MNNLENHPFASDVKRNVKKKSRKNTKKTGSQETTINVIQVKTEESPGNASASSSVGTQTSYNGMEYVSHLQDTNRNGMAPLSHLPHTNNIGMEHVSHLPQINDMEHVSDLPQTIKNGMAPVSHLPRTNKNHMAPVSHLPQTNNDDMEHKVSDRYFEKNGESVPDGKIQADIGDKEPRPKKDNQGDRTSSKYKEQKSIPGGNVDKNENKNRRKRRKRRKRMCLFVIVLLIGFIVGFVPGFISGWFGRGPLTEVLETTFPETEKTTFQKIKASPTTEASATAFPIIEETTFQGTEATTFPKTEGTTFQETDEECSESSCFNGGQCSDVDGFVSCNCSSTGYNGTRCESAQCNYRQVTDCSFGSCGLSVECDDLLATLTNTTEAECVNQGCVEETANTVSFYKLSNECRIYKCAQQLGFKLDFVSGDIIIYMKQPSYVSEMQTN